MPLDAKVMTLGDFLESNTRLIVPNYQRSYKWEQEYVADLFDDILEGLKLRVKSNKQSCFLGSIVLSHDPKTGLTDLVDGQQRLTTLAILVRRLAVRCPSTATAMKACRLLGDRNQPSILHKIVKSLSCDDRSAYREVALSDSPNFLIYGANNSRETARKNLEWKKSLEAHLIYKAQKPIDDEIDSIIHQSSPKISADDVLEKILNGIKLVIINTDERKEGMRVFASINASGTKLEPWELVMSAFYSHGGDSGAERTLSFFEGQTNSLSTILGDKTPEAADTAKNDFLRAHWITTNGHISKDDLFDSYNDLLSNNPELHKSTIESLQKSLRCYASFGTYKYTFQGKNTMDFEFLHTLTCLGAKLPRPALIATASLYDQQTELTEAMSRVTFIFEKLHMRWKICNLRTNIIEKPLAQIAKLIASGDLGTNPAELELGIYKKITELISFGPSRAQLVNGFIERSMFKEVKLSKAIASRINFAIQYPNMRKLDFTHIPKVNGGYTCEKGIKLKPSDHQIGISKYGFDNREEFSDLIESLGNTFFASSSKIIPSLPMNGDYQIGTLSANELRERRSYLAEVAADIWHF